MCAFVCSVRPHYWPGCDHYLPLKQFCQSYALLTILSAENVNALTTSHTHTHTKIISPNFMSLSLSTAACPCAPVMVHKAPQTPLNHSPERLAVSRRWQPFRCALALYRLANGKRRKGGGGVLRRRGTQQGAASYSRCYSTSVHDGSIHTHRHEHT